MTWIFAFATSFTYTKSRVCIPFPKIRGDSPALIRAMNLGMTAA